MYVIFILFLPKIRLGLKVFCRHCIYLTGSDVIVCFIDSFGRVSNSSRRFQRLFLFSSYKLKVDSIICYYVRTLWHFIIFELIMFVDEIGLNNLNLAVALL